MSSHNWEFHPLSIPFATLIPTRKFNFEGGLIYYVNYDVNDVGLILHYQLQHQHWIGESKPEESYRVAG